MTSPRPPEGTEPGSLHWLRYEHAGCVWNEVDQWCPDDGWRLQSRIHWTYVGPAPLPDEPRCKRFQFILTPHAGQENDEPSFKVEHGVKLTINGIHITVSPDVDAENPLAPLLVRAFPELEWALPAADRAAEHKRVDRIETLLADIRAAGVSWDTETVEGTVVGFVEPQRNMGE